MIGPLGNSSIRPLSLLLVIAGLSLGACGGRSDTPEDNDSDQMRQAMADGTDPNLWLEEVEGERALDWVRAENARSLEELQSHAAYAPMLAEAREILTSQDRIPEVSLRDGFAYNFWQDDTHVRGLWRRMPTAAYVTGGTEWETLLDIDALAEAEGENWVFEGALCVAPDYRRCMVTLSRGGSDAAVKREYDIAEKAFVEDGFFLDEAKSGVAWAGEDTLLIATDFGDNSLTESGYPRIVKRWQRGTAFAEAETLFEGEAEDVGVWPFSSWTGDAYQAGVVRAETFYDSVHYLITDKGLSALPFPPKTDLAGITQGLAIASLNQDWTYEGVDYPLGAVIGLDLADGGIQTIYAPADRTAVQAVVPFKGGLYLTLLDNIRGRLLMAQPRSLGWQTNTIDLPDNGVVSIGAVDEMTGDLLVSYENPSQPETLYYQKAGGVPTAIKSQPVFYAAEGVVTRQFEAISRDGTVIPYFVTAKESVLEAGPAPTIQYGYGGFQVSILPTYSGTTGRLWLERGGVYVIANIRGGGEFGPAWHQAGLKTERQKIYDDFFAVSESLIEKGITTPAQLGILGGSNGGLLMGVSLTQRPDLYGAVGIGVPLLDMLRFDQLLAGASWVGEYGSPDIAEERAFLETISPYHNLDPEADYPRPYFFTSTKDDRVHPGHARKMARLMQAYGHPFLYYENIEGGHGAAANLDQQAIRLALQFTYFGAELGLLAD
ncbi:prolyl oligopeptidase family protein [Parvularcula bermudensis HTCC2503]|uniref:Prolyl oligopeptidase family protein n=1 Tax=Parvularcula bermudensis (strain ATCC BAA-594 / HTCC2503 / KCTC 12087) TaxID=314260 RepID=E0TF51_PARBH|nr:prolyl oligopeptidase family serine peptidase [Parvularcula bermudensis]ADM08969.1 prolyl oligopeptidase family protein [Parvularcula bermudensis HTCC2503]